MELTKEEEKMLSGAYGEGYKRAIEVLVKLGEFYGAKRLVPVSMAILVKGPTPNHDKGKARIWLKELADSGATFRCPTFVALDELVENNYDYNTDKKLGAIFAFNDRGYARNLFYRPVFGQHVVAAGTAVVHYVNSYIGARANTECLIGQYSAAIVGKTPEYGFHLSKNRIGKILFEVKVNLKDETDWSAMGYYISTKLGNRYWDVPVINGIKPNDVTDDELVTFSTAIPGYAACVHSLLVGISPEALTLEQAFGGEKPKQTFTIGSEEINEVYNAF
ncbi:MAG: aconitase X, partial [Atribacterota bacterium]|nr:aconitase X [Atribacterota bacterium]